MVLDIQPPRAYLHAKKNVSVALRARPSYKTLNIVKNLRRREDPQPHQPLSVLLSDQKVHALSPKAPSPSMMRAAIRSRSARYGCHRKALAAGESVRNMAIKMMTARPPRAYCPQTHMRCPKGCLVISRSRAKGATTRASNQRAESRAVKSSSCLRTTSLPVRGLSLRDAERKQKEKSECFL